MVFELVVQAWAEGCEAGAWLPGAESFEAGAMAGTDEFQMVLKLGTDGFQTCGPGLGGGPRGQGPGCQGLKMCGWSQVWD